MQCTSWEGDYTDLQNFSYSVPESRSICDAVVTEVKFSETGVFFQTHHKILNITGTYVFCPVKEMKLPISFSMCCIQFYFN